MFIIEIAGVRVRIENKYSYIERLSKAFVVDGETFDFSVASTEEEIRREQELCGEVNSPAYCESFCLYRQICEKISAYGVFFMHSAVVEVDGAAYAFSAPSGVGKSTHISLWLKAVPGAEILNGDKPLYRIEPDGSVTACGTPWKGKENWGTNRKAPLRGVCFLERGQENRIRPISEEEALPRLAQQVYLQGARDSVNARLLLLGAFLRGTRFYVLECTISEDAARLAYEAMAAEKEIANEDQ